MDGRRETDRERETVRERESSGKHPLCIPEAVMKQKKHLI